MQKMVHLKKNDLSTERVSYNVNKLCWTYGVHTLTPSGAVMHTFTIPGVPRNLLLAIHL